MNFSIEIKRQLKEETSANAQEENSGNGSHGMKDGSIIANFSKIVSKRILTMGDSQC